MGQLEGKVAVVTGGASGVGEAAVSLFVAEGANVVIGDIQAERAATIAGQFPGSCVATVCDVSCSTDVERLTQLAVDEFGRLDVMFNNAGIGAGEGLIHETSEEVFDRIVAVDLKGVWLGIKHAVPHLLRAGGGSIINTASVAAQVAMKRQGSYGAAKGGVVQLSRAAAVEYGADAIRVNAICPGGVLTPMLYANAHLQTTRNKELVAARLAQLQPMRRACLPEDIAHAALWLASDRSSFVTGTALIVDGGWTAAAAVLPDTDQLTAGRPLKSAS